MLAMVPLGVVAARLARPQLPLGPPRHRANAVHSAIGYNFGLIVSRLLFLLHQIPDLIRTGFNLPRAVKPASLRMTLDWRFVRITFPTSQKAVSTRAEGGISVR